MVVLFFLAPVSYLCLGGLQSPFWLLLGSSCLWSPAVLSHCAVSRYISVSFLTLFRLELTVLESKDVCLSLLLENSFLIITTNIAFFLLIHSLYHFFIGLPLRLFCAFSFWLPSLLNT